MRHLPRLRFLLLASIALVAPAAWAQEGPAALPQNGKVLAAGTRLSATVWLRPHGEAALEAAVLARTTRGSPVYRHWMSPAEVAASDATEADVRAVAASLREAGLGIAGIGTDGQTITVTGSAAQMESAFQTSLRSVGQGRYAETVEPRLAGAAGALVAAVTGLGDDEAQPFAARQRNPATGAEVAPRVLPAALPPVDLASYFTDTCFRPPYHFEYARFQIGVGGVEDKMVGPHYIATGFKNSQLSCGYTAAEVQDHYGMGSLYASGLTGAGRTIVIVDAYGSPTILRDANYFNSEMGLPQLGFTNFSVLYPGGQPAKSPYKTGWPVEVSIDVEWAHAMAPGANIVLLVSPSARNTDLAATVRYAVRHHIGDVISNSYGQVERSAGVAAAKAYNLVFREAAAEGIAVFAATGDGGDFGLGTPVGAASVPANSPYATGVGGTSLSVPSDTGPVDSVWGITATFLAGINAVADPPYQDGFLQGGGGGESQMFAKPAWQKALPGTGRQLPDVSIMADPYTGAITFFPYDNGLGLAFAPYGGTSLSSPLMAGLWAVADQAAGESLGDAAPVISTLGSPALTDIVPIAADAKLDNNMRGIVRVGGTTTTYYGPAQLLGLQKTQPTGFVGTFARFTGPQYDVVEFVDLGFGADSSLMAGTGWDNATGYGTPNGPMFVKAAAGK